MADQPRTDRDWQSEAAAWRARAEHLQAAVDRLRSLAVAGESAGFLAHELNNLFTPVVGYCHAALDERAVADDAIKDKALRKALAAAERVGEVSRAILGLAGTVAGESQADFESDLGACVEAGLLVLGAERWGREGIEVKVDVPRGTCVKASAGVIQQVVMNLVLNARRAMEGRRGVLEVVARETAGVGGVVRMEVRDAGGGMNAEVMRRSLGITNSDDRVIRDQYQVDVQELARSGSINGQARWGVRVKAESEKRKADMKAGEKNIARLRGAKLDASMSPIRVWDAGEVAAELRSSTARPPASPASHRAHGMREKGSRDQGIEGSSGLCVGPVVGETDIGAGPSRVQSLPFTVQMEAGDEGRDSEVSPPQSRAFGGTGGTAGTGLGLALCLELVGRAGGRITARSEVGVGTVVVVEWPRAGTSARVAA